MKKSHTIYLEEDVSRKFGTIPKSYRSKFLNDLLADFFAKNNTLEFKIPLGHIVEKPENINSVIKLSPLDNEDAF